VNLIQKRQNIIKKHITTIVTLTLLSLTNQASAGWLTNSHGGAPDYNNPQVQNYFDQCFNNSQLEDEIREHNKTVKHIEQDPNLGMKRKHKTVIHIEKADLCELKLKEIIKYPDNPITCTDIRKNLSPPSKHNHSLRRIFETNINDPDEQEGWPPGGSDVATFDLTGNIKWLFQQARCASVGIIVKDNIREVDAWHERQSWNQ
jgi:hypothetical protein